MTLSAAVVKHPHFESFEEYLNYSDDNNQLYELFNGELVEVPPESGFNIGIAKRFHPHPSNLRASDKQVVLRFLRICRSPALKKSLKSSPICFHHFPLQQSMERDRTQ
jgi:hypothetical protein